MKYYLFLLSILFTHYVSAGTERGRCEFQDNQIIHEAYSCIHPESNTTFCISYSDQLNRASNGSSIRSDKWDTFKWDTYKIVDICPAVGHEERKRFVEAFLDGESHSSRCKFIFKAFLWACSHNLIVADDECLMAEDISDNYKSGRSETSIRLLKESMTAEIRSNGSAASPTVSLNQ